MFADPFSNLMLIILLFFAGLLIMFIFVMRSLEAGRLEREEAHQQLAATLIELDRKFRDLNYAVHDLLENREEFAAGADGNGFATGAIESEFAAEAVEGLPVESGFAAVVVEDLPVGSESALETVEKLSAGPEAEVLDLSGARLPEADSSGLRLSDAPPSEAQQPEMPEAQPFNLSGFRLFDPQLADSQHLETSGSPEAQSSETQNLESPQAQEIEPAAGVQATPVRPEGDLSIDYSRSFADESLPDVLAGLTEEPDAGLNPDPAAASFVGERRTARRMVKK